MVKRIFHTKDGELERELTAEEMERFKDNDTEVRKHYYKNKSDPNDTVEKKLDLILEYLELK